MKEKAESFKKELNDLLKRYKASIEFEFDSCGYDSHVFMEKFIVNLESDDGKKVTSFDICEGLEICQQDQ